MKRLQSGWLEQLYENLVHTSEQVELGYEHVQLQPLCQMRTANKKHRNIADIEIIDDAGNIIEAWDCKYGKPYLYEELYELSEKLQSKQIELVGFVVNLPPDLRDEVQQLLEEIAESGETDIRILSLQDWLVLQLQRYGLEQARDWIARQWLRVYIESLCQRRREKAPIDEPADQWVRDWINLIEGESNSL